MVEACAHWRVGVRIWDRSHSTSRKRRDDPHTRCCLRSSETPIWKYDGDRGFAGAGGPSCNRWSVKSIPCRSNGGETPVQNSRCNWDCSGRRRGRMDAAQFLEGGKRAAFTKKELKSFRATP